MNSKVKTGGAAGAITVILVWIVGLLGPDIPPEVASAITTLISTGAAWARGDRRAQARAEVAGLR